MAGRDSPEFFLIKNYIFAIYFREGDEDILPKKFLLTKQQKTDATLLNDAFVKDRRPLTENHVKNSQIKKFMITAE